METTILPVTIPGRTTRSLTKTLPVDSRGGAAARRTLLASVARNGAWTPAVAPRPPSPRLRAVSGASAATRPSAIDDSHVLACIRVAAAALYARLGRESEASALL